MTSPIASGGGGVALESRVIAYYLASVLLGGTVRGLRNYPAKRVKLQQAFADRPLDDLVIEGESEDGIARLDLQSKRSISVGDNELFNEVISQCWITYQKPDFRNNKDQFGFVLGTESRNSSAYDQVLHWARTSPDSTDFTNRINALASKPMKAFVASLTHALTKVCSEPVSNDQLWGFIKHLVILPFDFEKNDSSRDRLHVLDRLDLALSTDQKEKAIDLWNALIDLADNAKLAAATIDRETLVQQLPAHFKFSNQKKTYSDLLRVHLAAQRALSDISTDIGGVRLSRSTLLDDLKKACTGESIIEVSGVQGSGKSGLMKMFAALGDDVSAMVLKWDRLPIDPGWEGLAKLWNVENDLDTLVSELGCSPQPCLFIDGIDRISDPRHWSIVRDIFDAIGRSKCAPRWSIILTARSSSADYRTNLPMDCLPDFKPKRVDVEELNDDEIELIAGTHPKLAPLVLGNGRARVLARRPYFLRRLLQSKKALATDHSDIVTEVDLIEDLWTGHGNGDGVLRRQCQDALLEIGKRRIQVSGRIIRSTDISAVALESLVKDEILKEDDVSRRVSFAHDIIEDWVLSQVLDHSSENIAQTLKNAEQNPWLYDAIQLLAMWRLEREPSTDAWVELLKQVTQDDLEPRWRRAVLTAPLRSTAGYSLLKKIESTLLSDQEGVLKDLIVAIRATEVDPAPDSYVSALMPHANPTQKLSLAYQLAVPRTDAWAPFFHWAIPKIRELSPTLIKEGVLLLETLHSTSHYTPNWIAQEIAPLAFFWLRVLELDTYPKKGIIVRKIAELGIGHRDRNKLASSLQGVLVRTVKGAPIYLKQYLNKKFRRRSYRANEDIFQLSNLIAPHLPTDLVNFVLKTLIDEDEPHGFGSSISAWNDLGIDDSRMFTPPSHIRPPFLRLLQTHPSEGLRLINRLCNKAISTWRDLHLIHREGTPLPTTITFSWGKKEFWGHYREYSWFRGLGPGPNAVMSALMALEAWMEEEIRKERDLNELFQTVLEHNDCVAAVGACISICLANPDKALSAALPFATNPHLWNYDLRLHVQDKRESHANTIGSPRERTFIQANDKRNKLPHRQLMIRELVTYYLFRASPELKSEFCAKINSLSTSDLPFDFIEQQDNQDFKLEAENSIKRMMSVVDIKNWHPKQLADGRTYMLYEPPADLAKEAADVLDHQQALSDAMRPLMWAQNSLEDGKLHSSMSADDALALARKMDRSDLFDKPHDVENFLESQIAGAVSGVAATIIRYGGELSTDDQEWCRSVIHRASKQKMDGSFLVRESSLLFSPTVYAAHGTLGLFLRDIADIDDLIDVLHLSLHPLDQVAEVIQKALKLIWEKDPLLAWQIFSLGTRSFVMPWAVLSHGPSAGYTEGELQILRAAIAEIENDYDSQTISPLVTVPPHWQRTSLKASKKKEDWKRGEYAFLWHVAPKVLFNAPIKEMMAEDECRTELLRLTSELISWLLAYITPPWKEERSRYYDEPQLPYEWAHGFYKWCGKLSEFISVDETWATIVEPTLSIKRDTSFSLLASLVLGLCTHQLAQDSEADDKVFDLLSRLANRFYSDISTSREIESEYLGNGFGEYANALLFSYGTRPYFDHPWVNIGRVEEYVSLWSQKLSNHPELFCTLLNFLAGPGWPYLKGDAPKWLIVVAELRKNDQKFWDSYDNGGSLASLLNKLIDEDKESVAKNADLFNAALRLAEILLGRGIPLAARVQQILTKLKKRVSYVVRPPPAPS